MSDDGFTTLPGGLRLPKSDPLLEALGALDECNAALGLLRAALAGRPAAARLEACQRDLMQIGGELALGGPRLDAGAPAALGEETRRQKAGLPPPAGFDLPGRNEVSARAHAARTACRRAERELVRLREAHPHRVTAPALAFLNQLGTWLFVLAREA